jgi:spore coat protein H
MVMMRRRRATSQRRKQLSQLGLIAAFIAGCGEAHVGEKAPDADLPDAMPPVIAPSSDLAAWVFAEDEVRRYELEMGAAEWADLKVHARDEQYRAATLRVDGEPVGQVGLRFKGGISSLLRCVDAAGNVSCPKLSMKVKFDEYEPTLRFHGLKRLNFHSILEPSHLQERLAYRMFREMGVKAPRAVHAWLVMNGEPLGLFASVENVDGRFTDQHFERGDGNLYKEQWPGAVAPSRLELETDEETPDHGAMIGFGEDLARAGSDELASVVAGYLDLESTFAYVAVDRAISNWDGITAFYCNNGGCRNHNVFLYQHEDARFTLIPWDLNNTFSVVSSFEHVPNLLVIPPDCSLRYRVYGGFQVAAPGCDPLLQGLARSDLEGYRAQQTRLLDGPFDVAGLQAWIDAREAQLLPFVAEDRHGPSLLEFRNAVTALRSDIPLLALRLRAERDGHDTRIFRAGIDALTDFETATSLELQLGVSARAAPRSSATVALGDAGALGGQRDLLLSFAFVEGLEPRDQWARFGLRFDPPNALDLTAKSTLRLVLQADAPRTLRISFSSSNSSQVQTDTTPTLGWDVPLDGTRQEIELSLRSGTFPEWAPELPDTFDSAFISIVALLLDPLPVGHDAGRHGSGGVDAGRIRVDNIQLLP